MPSDTVDGGGNINADPLFVDDDGADNITGTLDDDLRLLPGSPCIDAAMGPYEFQVSLCSALPGDINCDGIVNLLDLSLLALHWLETN